MPLTAEGLVNFFINQGASSYEDIPSILELAREEHLNGFSPNKDFEQSWRSVKGRGLEKIIEYILRQQLDELDLRLSSLREVIDYLKIDYGDYGVHVPDVDLAVFQPSKCKVLAILSIKTSLRERATQTAYWRNKLRNIKNTQHIKVYFITPNSDDILRNDRTPNKQRAILETDIDATYIVNQPEFIIEDYQYIGLQSRIRLIEDLAADLQKLSEQ